MLIVIIVRVEIHRKPGVQMADQLARRAIIDRERDGRGGLQDHVPGAVAGGVGAYDARDGDDGFDRWRRCGG